MADHPTDQIVRAARRPRLTVSLGAVIVLVLVAIGIAVLISATTSAGAAQVIETAPRSAAGGGADAGDADVRTADEAPLRLLVHVLGAVRVPGLYELDDGARLVDAVAAAGGLADDADAAGVNLARRVADGEQIVVPRIGDAPAPQGSGTGAGPTGSAAGGAPVSLGTASSEQLQTLPRIGPALAGRIIAWREAGGRFQSVDDLLEVPGIGQGTVDGLRELAVP